MLKAKKYNLHCNTNTNTNSDAVRYGAVPRDVPSEEIQTSLKFLHKERLLPCYAQSSSRGDCFENILVPAHMYARSSCQSWTRIIFIMTWVSIFENWNIEAFEHWNICIFVTFFGDFFDHLNVKAFAFIRWVRLILRRCSHTPTRLSNSHHHHHHRYHHHHQWPTKKSGSRWEDQLRRVPNNDQPTKTSGTSQTYYGRPHWTSTTETGCND